MNCIELQFPVKGDCIPVDHRFTLYSAVTNVVPEFHAAENISMLEIRGKYVGEGKLRLQERSKLAFRLNPDEAMKYLPLTGKTLDVEGNQITIGAPEISYPMPTEKLHAPIVTTRNGHDPERFRTEVNRQLEEMGVKGGISYGRTRTLRIHGKQIVGYSLTISGLSQADALTLMEKGIGGRRKMGCGVFLPVTRN